MGSTASVLSTLPRAIVAAAASYQVDTTELLRAAGIVEDAFDSPTVRIADTAVRKLWAAAVRLTGDPCLGLVTVHHLHATSFHSLGFAWLASPTLRDMLKRLVRYERVLVNAHWVALEEADGRTAVRLSLPGDEQPAAACRGDAAFVAVTEWSRHLAGADLAPAAVELRHGDHGQHWRYEEAFKAPIRFDASSDRLWFADEVLDRELRGGNAPLAAQADTIADAYLASLADEPYARRVRQCLVDLLPQGEAELDTVAARLFMSARSLQRHLAEENHSFRALLEETRMTLAEQYVSDGNLALAEIAFRLGFSDQSAFSKAYRRWTGTSPAQRRR